MNDQESYDSAIADSLSLILQLVDELKQSNLPTVRGYSPTEIDRFKNILELAEDEDQEDDGLDELLSNHQLRLIDLRLACCSVLVSLHDRSVLNRVLRSFANIEFTVEHEACRLELEKIFGLLESDDVPTLLNFISRNDDYPKTQRLSFETVIKISDRDALVLTNVQSQLKNCLSHHKDHSPSAMAWMIQLASHWKMKDFAPLIEKAFSKNLVDTSVCGDWPAVRERLGVPGQGLPMPAKPLNLVEQRKIESGICIFSDVPLFVDCELDEKAYRLYADKACNTFAESQEWKSLNSKYDSPIYLENFLDIALQYLGLNVETMTALDLSELMLDYFPSQVTIDLNETSYLVDELIAFWKFCGRAYGLEHARANVNFMEKNRRQIQREMANRNNYGIAKTLLNMASDAGYDLEQPEEMNEFVENLNSRSISRLAGFRNATHDEPQYSLAEPTTRNSWIDNHRVDQPAIEKTSTPPLPLKERKKLLAKLKKRK